MAPVTQVSKRSGTLIPVQRFEVEPELEPLIPAEPQLNLDAFARYCEAKLMEVLRVA